MKLHILSDLHTEFAKHTPSAVAASADAVVLAGDIGAGVVGLRWAAHAYPDRPLIYVPGNHEYYGCDLDGWMEAAQAVAAEYPHLHLCQREGVVLSAPGEAPIRVLGTTLWTDFKVYGAQRRLHVAMLVQRVLYDYKAIRVGKRHLQWEDTAALFEKNVTWLLQESKAARARGEKVVVVSHHAPSLKSCAPQFLDDLVTGGFGSNLEVLASQHADYWIHGHMHNSSSYTLGSCHVVANPRGYPRRNLDGSTTFENPRFDPDLILEVK